MAWQLHFLTARGQLGPWRGAVSEAVEAVRRRVAAVVEPPPLDFVVQSIAGGGIPERGHMGSSPAPGLVFLTLDPANPCLARNMGRPFERMVAHEVNHAMRWDGPGYGRTLGEALVSEGLAGRFVRHLYADPPEPWEDAAGTAELARGAALARAGWDDRGYDHGRWFHGRGDLPRWLGYTLGYRIVGAWLEARPALGVVAATGLPASGFRGALDRLAPAPR